MCIHICIYACVYIHKYLYQCVQIYYVYIHIHTCTPMLPRTRKTEHKLGLGQSSLATKAVGGAPKN